MENIPAIRGNGIRRAYSWAHLETGLGLHIKQFVCGGHAVVQPLNAASELLAATLNETPAVVIKELVHAEYSRAAAPVPLYALAPNRLTFGAWASVSRAVAVRP
jgi:hypothetical protein